MNKPKINIKASLFSMLGAAIGAGAALLLSTVFPDTVVMRIVWTGLFFSLIMLGGGLGLHIYLSCTKKYAVSRRPLWIVFLSVAILVVGLLGALGQYLFMIDKEEKKDDAVGADIVLLLDCSGSMSAIESPRAEASAKFIDYLNEDFRLQVVPFGSTVFRYNTSELLVMNEENKSSQKALISSLVSAGQTDFDEPFEFAYESLEANKRKDAKQVVMILSDAIGLIPDGIKEKYEESDIKVYSLRFEDSNAPSSVVNEFVDFVDGTGGFDIPLKLNSNSSIDAKQLEKAFEKVFEATVEYVPTMNSNSLVCSEDSLSFWHHLIRFVTFALCSAVIGVGYFAQFDVKGLIFNAIIGLLASAVVAVFEGMLGNIFCCFALAIILGTAIVSLEEKQDAGGYYYNV